MNKADKAESLFRTGYNCSQSVYAAFAEELGITVEEAAKKASPFGAGFGKLREVCGAVTGMVMVIGDLYGYELKVSFYSFIRPEQRFSSVEMLKEQMERDIETSRSRMMSINGDM